MSLPRSQTRIAKQEVDLEDRRDLCDPSSLSAHAITVDRLHGAGELAVSVDIRTPDPMMSGLACGGSR